jgi:predicted N-formylglutamate amidohydrolase
MTTPLALRPHEAFEIVDADAAGPWVVTCDHASNAVPDWLGGTLGLSPEDMARHIAFDLGAAGLARGLARRLGSPAILGRFSRLVIDPNRGEDDPTLLMRLYDATIIPGNRHAGPEEVARRLGRLYRPYHDAVEALLASRAEPAVLAVHSFTPQLRNRPPRPWHVAVLHSHRDERLARPVLRRLGAEPDLFVGDNEPYTGHLPGDSIDRHALGPGRLNVLIEVRQDLLDTPDRQEAWADRLAPLLHDALEEARHG